jgi:H+-transporting ATPase
MPPLGWHWALVVWGYALAWFVVNDRIKLAAYKVFGRQGEGLLARTTWLEKQGVAAA